MPPAEATEVRKAGLQWHGLWGLRCHPPEDFTESGSTVSASAAMMAGNWIIDCWDWFIENNRYCDVVTRGPIVQSGPAQCGAISRDVLQIASTTTDSEGHQHTTWTTITCFSQSCVVTGTRTVTYTNRCTGASVSYDEPATETDIYKCCLTGVAGWGANNTAPCQMRYVP